MKKKLVVLTGAGISAESGLKTFRDMGGLWEEYDVMEVASADGWIKNMDLVLSFYNARRRQLETAVPNQGHITLAELEEYFDVHIITQNVDDLHERAGSTKVLHLHGELKKARSSADPNLIYDIGTKEINSGDLCELGSQLRPHIVWFGEMVPAIEDATDICRHAELFAVIGTSLNVYPAAGLVDFVPHGAAIYLIDPNETSMNIYRKYTFIQEKASVGVLKLKNILLE
jgi:NAD-dependent deacetylase